MVASVSCSGFKKGHCLVNQIRGRSHRPGYINATHIAANALPSPSLHLCSMSVSLGFQEYVWTDVETLETLARGLRFSRTHVSKNVVHPFYLLILFCLRSGLLRACSCILRCKRWDMDLEIHRESLCGSRHTQEIAVEARVIKSYLPCRDHPLW